MSLQNLVIARPQSLYCPAGDFYIDPWRPVHRAVISRAHADHAGHGEAPTLLDLADKGALAAGWRCAAPAAARAWTAALCSATMPTGRACNAPLWPPAPNG